MVTLAQADWDLNWHYMACPNCVNIRELTRCPEGKKLLDQFNAILQTTQFRIVEVSHDL